MTQVIQEEKLPGGRNVILSTGNILDEPVEGIVNAANGMLVHGGGVAAVIAEAAGKEMVDECQAIIAQIGRLPTGDAVATGAGRLGFKGIIHAVGPRQGEGDEEQSIVKALKSAFSVASEQGWQSLSFPGISAGIFAVPAATCARAYLRAIRNFFLERPSSPLKVVRLCLLDVTLIAAVRQAWQDFSFSEK